MIHASPKKDMRQCRPVHRLRRMIYLWTMGACSFSYVLNLPWNIKIKTYVFLDSVVSCIPYILIFSGSGSSWYINIYTYSCHAHIRIKGRFTTISAFGARAPWSPFFQKKINRHFKVSKSSEFFYRCWQWHIVQLCKFLTRNILYSFLHKKDKSWQICKPSNFTLFTSQIQKFVIFTETKIQNISDWGFTHRWK